jgi:hypothetical protein
MQRLEKGAIKRTMSHGKHSIDLAIRSGFQAIALLLVFGVSGPKLSAQFDGYTLTPLEKLNTTDDEVLIGWDGRTIYFSRSERSDDDKGNQGWFRKEKSDWESQRTQGWTDFESPHSVVLRAFSSANWPGFDAVQHVAIDEARGVLVMSAAESARDFDLYMAQESDGGWSIPRPLTSLNTDGDEVFPNFQSGTLLFASNGRTDGLGGFDVFQSLRADHYGSAQPLAAPLNSPGDELAAIPAGEGNEAGFYLAAARMAGSGMDLWWAGRPSQKESEQAEFALEFRFQRTPMSGLRVNIQERGGAHVFSGQSDGAGRVRVGSIKLDAAMSVQVTADDGRKSIPDGAVCHVFERCTDGSCEAEYWKGWRRVRSYRMEGGSAFVFDLLPLDALGRWPRPNGKDSSQLNKEGVVWTGRFEKSRFQLAENDRIELLNWLNRAKTGSGEWPEQWKLEVVGYADASGSVVQNEALSKLRAEHAKTVALATGLDPNRIVCEGKGSLGSFGASKFDRRVELRWVPLQ